MALEEAALYEMPFEYVRRTCLPVRSRTDVHAYAEKWWQYAKPDQECACIQGQPRFIVTPEVAKHRIFVGASRRFCATSKRSSSPAPTTTSSACCTPDPRAWARAHGHTTARGRERLPLHPHHHLRDLPLPLAARAGAGGRPGRGDRGGGAGAGGAAGALAVIRRGRARRTKEAHADEPVQRGAPRGWTWRIRGWMRRCWMRMGGRGDVSDEEILAWSLG